MTQYKQYKQLPSSNATHTVQVMLSQMISIRCRCGYHGMASRITGCSTYPIYTCPQCRRVVQLEAK